MSTPQLLLVLSLLLLARRAVFSEPYNPTYANYFPTVYSRPTYPGTSYIPDRYLSSYLPEGFYPPPYEPYFPTEEGYERPYFYLIYPKPTYNPTEPIYYPTYPTPASQSSQLPYKYVAPAQTTGNTYANAPANYYEEVYAPPIGYDALSEIKYDTASSSYAVDDYHAPQPGTIENSGTYDSPVTDYQSAYDSTTYYPEATYQSQSHSVDDYSSVEIPYQTATYQTPNYETVAESYQTNYANAYSEEALVASEADYTAPAYDPNYETQNYNSANYAAEVHGSDPYAVPTYGSELNASPAYNSDTNTAPTYGSNPYANPTYGSDTYTAPTFGPDPYVAPTYVPSPSPVPTYVPSPSPVPTYGPSAKTYLSSTNFKKPMIKTTYGSSTVRASDVAKSLPESKVISSNYAYAAYSNPSFAPAYPSTN